MTGLALAVAQHYGLPGWRGVLDATRALSAAFDRGHAQIPELPELLEPESWAAWLSVFGPRRMVTDCDGYSCDLRLYDATDCDSVAYIDGTDCDGYSCDLRLYDATDCDSVAYIDATDCDRHPATPGSTTCDSEDCHAR